MKMMENKSLDDKWRFFVDRLQYMKASIDPRYLLETLGFKITNETNGEIRAACIIHGGDNKSAFRFNKKTHTWVCFTNKCHEAHGNDVIGLIKGVLNLNFKEAVEYLQNMVGDLDDPAGNYLKFKRDKEKNEFINQIIDRNQKPSIVADDILKYYKPLRSAFFESYGFTKKTLDFFEIAGGYTDSEGYVRDIIPIRNDQGELMAYSMRDIRKDAIDNDFKYILTKGFEKDKVLYNLNNAKEYGTKYPIIIVEGFKSVWRLYQAGIYNVVAAMGSEITAGQINLLCRYALRGIIIMFDNDMPGINGTLNAFKNISNKMDVHPIFLTEVDENGKGLDPADLSEMRLKEYLEGAYGE